MKRITAAILLSCNLLTAPMPEVEAPFWLRVQNWLRPRAVTELSIQHTLDTLTGLPRLAGTENDDTARAYLMDTFTKYGYQVEEQTFEFTAAEALQGIQTDHTTANIIATKKTGKPDSDILIISSHFDTVAGTAGANDNASGTTVLLETAKAVSKIPSDTEIRFIAFGAEEEGCLGSSYYVSTLSEDEKARIIGDIQLDMLGHYRSSEVLIATPADTQTLVGNLINDSAEKLTGRKLNTGIESASDHSSFISGGIPAVLLMQDNLGVENHKVTDQASIISAQKLKEMTDIVIDTVKTVADSKTVDLSKAAHEVTDLQNPAYTITDETILFFGEKKSLNDGRIGGPGKLTNQRHDDDLDWDFESYSYNARWFGMEEPVPTAFEYRVLGSGQYLTNVTIDYSSSPYSMEEVETVLTEHYGAPTVSGDSRIWVSPMSSRQYIVEGQNKTVQVFNSYFGSGEEFAVYDISGGIEQYADAPANEKKLLQFLQSIIGDDGIVDTLVVWSDGLSYQLGACYPNDSEKNDKFTVRIDITDAFDEDGNFRNFDKTLVTVVHEYGHALTLNDTQVDMEKKDKNLFYYNRECYREGSYILDFYNQFWKELGTENASAVYAEHPDWFVSQYSSQSADEDIAESFAMFVLTDKPAGDTLAEQKIRFFYNYPQLISIRERIRTAFAL